jgi:hypothetical protein
MIRRWTWSPLTLCLLLVFATPGHAEYCWMVGCANALGYIRVERNDAGRLLPFAGDDLPPVGREAKLCSLVYLRVYAMAGPPGKEEERRIATAGLLGLGTTVKILDYVQGHQGRKFAAVRVLHDVDKCPSACGTCVGGWF